LYLGIVLLKSLSLNNSRISSCLMMVILIAGFSAGAGDLNAAESVKNLGPREINSRITENIENITLIDVRTSREQKSGVIKNAILISIYDEKFTEKINKLNKKNPVYVYCASGRRSTMAANKLLENGFENVTNMKGGINVWKEMNLPVIVPDIKADGNNSASNNDVKIDSTKITEIK